MSVIRVNKTKDFTVMSNHHFRDKRLSLKAKGLLSQMLSLPEGWDYTIAGLACINKENETAVKSGLKELEGCGYLIITKLLPNKTKSGRIEYIYDIYEQPQGIEKQAIEKQGVEILGVENQALENRPQYNTKETNTKDKLLNKKLNKEALKNEFERIWQEYPKKQGKENALKAYIKERNKRDYGSFNEYTVLDGIKRYKRYIEANKIEPQFIKQGSTWFNQHCWEDDYSIINGQDNSYLKAEGDLPF